MTTKTTTVFRIADGIGGSLHPETFFSFEDAKQVLYNEYTNRSKRDGNDEYWRNRVTLIQKVTTTIEVVFNNKQKY